MGRLDGITLLESLTEDERADLEKRCQWRRYAKGDEVVTRNSDNRDMFLITEGAVDIINYSPGFPMWDRPNQESMVGKGLICRAFAFDGCRRANLVGRGLIGGRAGLKQAC